MPGKDLTKKIEQLEAFEEKADVRLQALSAFYYHYNDGRHGVAVMGELHPRRGTELTNNVKMTLTVYDSNGRVTGNSLTFFFKDKFFGFEPFQLGVWLPNGDISKIRLLPQRDT